MFPGLQIFKEVILNGIQGLRMHFFATRRDKFGYLDISSSIRTPMSGAKHNVYIYENCGINSNANFVCQAGKFILKRNCSVGPGLTVITFNHKYTAVGQRPESKDWGELEPADVLVEEDVWIGANVVLCPGTIIGRGSMVAAGSVCVKSKKYPPYAIIGGNPARFIRFRLTVEEQLKQEALFYSHQDRIPVEVLRENFLQFSNC